MSARILLVEDEPGLVIILTDLLKPEGYIVDTASDGVSGLARALSESFDLILLDVMLPGKNGLDVCRDLRQQGRDIPILMLTAKTQLIDRVVGLKLGADDYITKPFEPPELLARIEAPVQHWMGHKSLETTMRYLAPATDVHDELDLVTIPSVGRAAPAPRKSAARETRSLRKGARSHARAEGPVPARALKPGT